MYRLAVNAGIVINRRQAKQEAHCYTYDAVCEEESWYRTVVQALFLVSGQRGGKSINTAHAASPAGEPTMAASPVGPQGKSVLPAANVYMLLNFSASPKFAQAFA